MSDEKTFEPKETYIQHLEITVTAKMTTPSKPGKKPRPVWEVTGYGIKLYGLADVLRDMGGRRWHSGYSFWEDPTEQLQEFDRDDLPGFEDRVAAKQERAEARADRLEDRAEKHAKAGVALCDQARKMASVIPFGQPILVGHHSEKRDRNYRNRIHRTEGKGYQELGYAKHLETRADAARYTASGEQLKSQSYLSNRIAECEKELRAIAAELEGTNSVSGYRKPSEQRCQILQQRKQEWESRLQFFKGKLEEIGGLRVTPEMVKVGDFVRWIGEWSEVFKVNKKTVGLHTCRDDQSWNDNVEWSKIRGHMTREQFDAFDGEKTRYVNNTWVLKKRETDTSAQ